MAALVDKGGARDEEVVAMIAQVSAFHRDLMVDALTCCLRMRLGLAVARVDRLSAFGSLIALIDAEVSILNLT